MNDKKLRFSVVVAKAYDVYMRRLGQDEHPPLSECSLDEQAAFEAVINFIISLYDYDAEDAPDMDAIANDYGPTWVPPRLRSLVEEYT